MTPRKLIIGSTVAGLAALGGLGLATANAAPGLTSSVAGFVAQTDTHTSTDSTADQTAPPVGADRPAIPDEEALTADIADQVTAAALAAVPGGIVERVENDADGSSDGSSTEDSSTDSGTPDTTPDTTPETTAPVDTSEL